MERDDGEGGGGGVDVVLEQGAEGVEGGLVGEDSFGERLGGGGGDEEEK